jgi:glucose/arabinose dehydrogenase/mono/diheme cytochrome c family protein
MICRLIWSACLWALAIGSGTTSATASPLQRVPNTSLSSMPVVPGSLGYTFANAFPTLVFTNPVCIATVPGETNRLFVLEKRGRIVAITNLAAPTRTIFLDMTAQVTSGSDTDVGNEQGLLGLAFHPGYATNGYFYVFYVGNTNTGTGTTRHDILARYQVAAGNPNQANASSHQPLLLQRDDYSNHNGGDIHFGPDGYLYVSLGDEGSGDDQGANSQRITKDFFSGILRLDVDKRPGNVTPSTHPATTTNYAVPADNPYIGATTFNGVPINPALVLKEFWAVGLRNPWRMAFDPDTGILYCGDVGQGTREEISLIERGKNYGWTYWEGFFQRTNNINIPAGFVHAPPLIDYPRSLGFAVTGGRVYRGTKISQLYGAYVYGDYGSGRIWALRHTGTNVTQNQLILTDAGVTAFGTDPSNGDILYCDAQSGNNSVIKRIVYNSTFSGTPIPTNLTATGVFTNIATLEVAPGIVGYDLNVPFWSDNAIKTRWFSIPNTNHKMTLSTTGNWLFPTGTVWIKHFELEITNGVPASRRRLETRLLVSNTNGGYGVTYRWTEPPTNALLVAEAGADEVITTYTAGGQIATTQTWRYPARAECLVCHTPAGGFALGFNSAQLNRDYNYGSTVTNQIEALSLAGYFSNAVTNRHLLPALAPATDETASREYRVRSYLAANCVQCHQPAGSAQALWDARLSTPGFENGIINGALNNNSGNPANRVIVPGSLANSILYQRVANLGPGHMPPLATSVVDTQAVALLATWITNDLNSYVSFAAWQSNYFGATNNPNAALLADPDNDRAKNYLEYLTGTVPTNAASGWGIGITNQNGTVQIVIPQIANRAIEVQSTTNLTAVNSWQPLNLPANAPFFPATNRVWSVTIPEIAPEPHYYRVRVFEP